jgi:uncharacterized FlaG/YvyC family protein
MSTAVGSAGRELAFSLESPHRITIKILDSETKEVIKQIPNEKQRAVTEEIHRRLLDEVA